MIKFNFKNSYIIYCFRNEEVTIAELSIYVEFESKYEVFNAINQISDLEKLVINLKRLINSETTDSSFSLPQLLEPTLPCYWWVKDYSYFCSTASETVAFFDKNSISNPIYQPLSVPTALLLEICEKFIKYRDYLIYRNPEAIYLNYELYSKWLHPKISAKVCEQYFRATLLSNHKLSILDYTFFSSYPDIVENKTLRYGLLHHHLIVLYPYDNFSYLMFFDKSTLLNIIEQIESILLDNRVAYQWEYQHILKFIARKEMVEIRCKKGFSNGKPNQFAPTTEVLQMLKDFVAYIESRSDMPLRVDRNEEELKIIFVRY